MTQTPQPAPGPAPLRIGWDQQEITPHRPVLIAGQFHARVSEGVKDPLTVTAMAIDNGQDHVVFVSCDVVSLLEDAFDDIGRLVDGVPGLDPAKLVINATHTHTSADTRKPDPKRGFLPGSAAIDLGVDLLPVEEYYDFFIRQVALAVRQAWERRSPGSLAHGMTHAVIGHNRRWTNLQGVSRMYGDTTVPEFSHIEGYEDHAVNILAAWDDKGALTGVLVNVACPSQVSESEWTLSADYWHDVRQEIRQRHGQHVFTLGQCSAAGDQAPRSIWGKAAEERMLKLKGRSAREEIARRLADAVDDVLPAIKPVAQKQMVLRHVVRAIDLPYNALTQKDVDDARAVAEAARVKYEAEKARIEADPSIRQQPRWYKQVTMFHRQMTWQLGVVIRHQQMQDDPTYKATVHVVRIGDMVLASNPFEYYLDYGVRIKARSPFEQTFLVQLCGRGTYVPSPRSVAGGGYGSMPASNPVGPQGGHILCEKTLDLINELHA